MNTLRLQPKGILFYGNVRMKRKPKPRNQAWLIAAFVALAVLVLLLRLLVFVAGHRRHSF